MSQSPSLRGSGRFVMASIWTYGEAHWSQSPSLRGSGRFKIGVSGASETSSVSIPFIAGQWSLPVRPRTRARRTPVSIPFIAGQWSLLLEPVVRPARASSSQSPSLRGSGRFRSAPRKGRSVRSSLNPLHCGAVVASRAGRAHADLAEARLNPLHCGAVVASRMRADGYVFRRAGLNPLHCGAVVASRGRRARARRGARLNPLHCGAVVASRLPPPLDHAGIRVSIPFIAGQWSLPTSRQSGCRWHGGVSIPFIAGQWSLLHRRVSRILAS